MRGHRGDFPAASAPCTHARRARLPGALEDRARPGLVGEREWLCGSAPPLPTRAAEPPRPSAPPSPGWLAARPGPLTCGLPAPRARLCVPRYARVEGAAGCATSSRPHLPRGPTPRPGPGPAPRDRPRLHPASTGCSRRSSRAPRQGKVCDSHRAATCASLGVPDRQAGGDAGRGPQKPWRVARPGV